jgi:DNA polymerase-4
LAGKIFAVARDLLKREADGTKFRLIGVGLSDLAAGAHADPHDLVDTGGRRDAAAEHAVDRVREKFGRAAIVKGLVFED